MKSFIRSHILPNLSKWRNHGHYHSVAFGYRNEDERLKITGIIEDFIKDKPKYFMGKEEGIIKVVKYE